MNEDGLMAYYARIADAPDAIVRLRRFVLDLAVRGKLVPQDANDEPASELLKRIAKERARLDRKERAKRQPKTINGNAEPLQLPRGWAIAPLADLVSVLNGRAYKQNELLSVGTPVLRVGNLFTSDKWYYSNLKLDDDKYCEKGDLIFAWSASFGPFIWGGEKVIYHYHIWKLPLHSETDLDKLYLYNFLLQKTREIKEAGHGISMIHMTKEKMELFQVPLPPLAEQHRIVAKVNELMALCGRLEAARTEREATRDRLTVASLARLNAPDSETFQDDARFALDALPALTTRPDQIKQLRQTILNLAVRGHLLESAEAELDRVAMPEIRKARLAACISAAERTKVTAEFERLEKEWEQQPDQPKYVTTQCACHFITKGTTPASNELLAKGEIPFLKVYNIVNNKIDFDYRPTFVSRHVHEKVLTRSAVRPGDVIMNIVGPPLGKVALVGNQYPEWNINQALAFFRPLSMFDSRFIALVLTAPITIQNVLTETRGTVGQDNLSLEQVRSLEIPAVALAVQHRIVSKVDALMALCDHLQASLTTADDTRRRLLEALLADALAPATDLEMEAAE